MISLAKRQALHVWIALMAILFSALAPAVSHALAAGSAADTLEMCTVDGYKLVKLSGAGGDKAPASAAHGMQHCAFCGTHGGVAPPVVAPMLAEHAGHDLYPSLFHTAPHALHAWSAAHPRAPPLPA